MNNKTTLTMGIALLLLLGSTNVTAQPPISIDLHIIGFAVDADTESQLRDIAAAGNGRYYGAADEAALDSAFSQALNGASSTTLLSAEAEDNNRLSQANPIAASGESSGSISPQKDTDWYRIEIPRRGQLTVTIDNMPAELDIVMRLWNADAKTLSSWHGPPQKGQSNEKTLDLPEAGHYYLELADSHHDQASSDAYTLRLNYHPGDEYEPNEHLHAAVELRSAEPLTASILPLHDTDWYHIQVERQGRLDVQISGVADTLDIVYRLWNADAKTLSGWQSPPRKGGDTVAQLKLPEGGSYYLEVADSHHDAASPAAYTLEAVYHAGDEHEPNDRLSQATALPMGEPLQASVLPTQDTDWYHIQVQRQGELTVQVSNVPPELDIVYRLWNRDGETLSGWQGPPRKGADTVATFALPGDGSYYLELADSHHDAAAPELYTLEAIYQAGDQYEPNDRLSQATTLSSGTPVQANILPRHDIDWYRLQLGSAGRLEVLVTQVPADLDVVYRLWNADGETLSGWQGPPRKGADTAAVLDIREAGTYYLEVADSHHDASDAQPYTLQIQFNP